MIGLRTLVTVRDSLHCTQSLTDRDSFAERVPSRGGSWDARLGGNFRTIALLQRAATRAPGRVALTFSRKGGSAISRNRTMDAMYRAERSRSSSGRRASGRGGPRRVRADLFKSLAVRLTRVESRKHTRFSLFSRGRARRPWRSGVPRRDSSDRSPVVPPLGWGSQKASRRQWGTFEKYRRPRAGRSRPVAADRITRQLHPSPADWPGPGEAPPTTHEWGRAMLSNFLARGGAVTERSGEAR